MMPQEEPVATSLWDAYSSLLSHQAMILAVNSSFVDPLLQFEAQLTMIESSFRKTFSIPSFDEVREICSRKNDKDLENLHQNILNVYEDTLLILVSKDLYKLQILKEMAVWMSEDTFYLQERALVIITRVLSFVSRKARGFTSVDTPCLGTLAAELSLLCSHTDPSITHQASFGMYYLLCIAKCQHAELIKNKTAKHDESCLLTPFSKIEFLPNLLKQDKVNIAQSVGQILLPSLLTDFLWRLLMKLSAPDSAIAFEAAILLKLTLEYHAEKVTMVSKIVDAIYNQLRQNSSHVMKHAMLHVITLLTHASPKKVIFQLMDYPVPADDTLMMMWHAAGSESKVAPQALKTILLILKGKPGEMEDYPIERRRLSLDSTNMMPVAASQALCTLLPIASYKKVVAEFFPQLLMALMLQLSYSSRMSMMADDSLLGLDYARDALQELLNCSGLQEVDVALKKKNCWDQFSHEMFQHHGVYLVAKTLCDHNFPQFPETLHYLYKLSVEGPKRSEDSIITVIFLTELLNNFFRDPFPEEFLVLFQNWVNDSNPAVSKLSLQKIASMAPVINQIENVSSLLLAILDSFLSKDKTVIIRALLTLRKLLGKLDRVTYSSLCTRIASSYCPLMDHGYSGIRCMAIRHFGELLKDMSHYTWMLNHVVLGGLVPLILFLEDTEIRVANLISHMSYVTELIADTLGFLSSSRAYLRRSSVILIGYLATLGGHLLLKDEIDVMLDAIKRVVRDEDPVIRELAKITQTLFQEVAQNVTPTNMKQSVQKLLRFIYVKKVKPLYNYNWPSDLTGSPLWIQEIKNDKDGLMHENYEDFLQD